MAGCVRVFLACSLDGFIAGPDDDLSWLPDDEAASAAGSDPEAVSYEAFIADVGALLMGRRTYDVVAGFDVPWPYGERPVLVATHRPLASPKSPRVRPVSGTIAELVAAAREAAGEKDVYLDGGILIRQALEAGLVDALIVTLAPVALGRGIPLFAGLAAPCPLAITAQHRDAFGMLQLHLRPSKGPAAG